jgi:hypothetical protein
LAAQFNIKIDGKNKRVPLHLEMVRENFQQIVGAIKASEKRQNELEK